MRRVYSHDGRAAGKAIQRPTAGVQFTAEP